MKRKSESYAADTAGSANLDSGGWWEIPGEMERRGEGGT